MRINSIPPQDLLYQYVHVDERRPTVKPTMATDRVELTGDAVAFSSALRAAKEQMEAGGVTNQSRVEAIKAQIADNSYFVPGIRIAEKMLGE